MKIRPNLIAALFAVFCAILAIAGCTAPAPTGSTISTTQPTTQPGIINPFTGKPVTGADLQTASADLSGLLEIAQAAGLNNADVQLAQTLLPTITNAATTVVNNENAGLPADQQVLSDAAAALKTYATVKTAIATHPAVVATVKAKAAAK